MEENIDTFEVPQNVIIDGLRNEVARLNDERISMMLKLQFANQVIEALKHQLDHAHGHDHDHDHDHDHSHEEPAVEN